MDRRGFLTGLGALLAAPAIVRSGLVMPISTRLQPRPLRATGYHSVSLDAFGDWNEAWFETAAEHVDHLEIGGVISVQGVCHRGDFELCRVRSVEPHIGRFSGTPTGQFTVHVRRLAACAPSPPQDFLGYGHLVEKNFAEPRNDAGLEAWLGGIKRDMHTFLQVPPGGTAYASFPADLEAFAKRLGDV